MGNKQKLSKFREVEMLQYLEEALFLLELIGISVFKEPSHRGRPAASSSLIPSVKNTSEGQRAIREKKEAIAFLEANGVAVGKQTNFAKRGDVKPEFWINPKSTVVEKDWHLILNNQVENVLLVLYIPANSFTLKHSAGSGLIIRGDRPDRIELKIHADTLIDLPSKCSFGDYVVARINY